MSAKPALIRQRDVTKIMRGASDAGIAMGIVVKDGEVRFLPVDEIRASEEPSALERWKAARNAGEVDGAA